MDDWIAIEGGRFQANRETLYLEARAVEKVAEEILIAFMKSSNERGIRVPFFLDARTPDTAREMALHALEAVSGRRCLILSAGTVSDVG